MLNPRFWQTGINFDEASDFECLTFVVYSKGDPDTLHRYLENFTRTPACAFVPDREGMVGEGYCRHGRFILPVRFKTKEIDFGALKEPLYTLLEFLKKAPVTNQ